MSSALPRRWSADTLLAALFFAAVFLFLLRPVGAEQDFWWHLANGRWIMEHGTLPAVDPFGLFPLTPPSPQDLLVLRGFWLSQLLYLCLYKAGGLAAIALLGALTMTLTVFFVWRTLCRTLPAGISLLPLTPLLLAARFVSEIRPQQFTFLCFALLILLLEQLRAKLREQGKAGLPGIAIPLLILLWAQLHPGYIMGIPLIAIALAAALPAEGSKERSGAIRSLLLVGTASAAAALTPAAGVSSLLASLGSLLAVMGKTGSNLIEFIDYERPWQVASVFGPWYWRLLTATLILVAASAALQWRVIPRRFLAMTLLYALLSLTAFRFGCFFFITGTIILGHALVALGNGVSGALPVMATRLCTSVLALLLAISGVQGGIFTRGLFTPSLVSEKAIATLVGSGIPGGVFSPYSWGGYLIWRAWPQYRIFCDQRTLGGDGARSRYRSVLFMDTTAVLDELAINAVVMNQADVTTASVYYGFLTLMESAAWDLVYYDDIAVVFCRHGMGGKLPVLDKSSLERDLLRSLSGWQQQAPDDVAPPLLLGQLRFWRGDFKGAENYFRAAGQAAPGDVRAAEWLEAVATAAAGKR